MDKKQGWVIGAIKYSGDGTKHNVYWSGGNYSASGSFKDSLTNATLFTNAESVIDRLYHIYEKQQTTEDVVSGSVTIFEYATKLIPAELDVGIFKEERERRALKKLSFNDLEALDLKDKATFYKLSENEEKDLDDKSLF